MSDHPASDAGKHPFNKITLFSFALNIFLICGIAAFLLASPAPPTAPHLASGGPARQFEFLALRLPASDADVLRAEFYAKSAAIDEAHTAAHRTRDAVRQALSAEPYDIEATRKAIAQAETAHLQLDNVLQEVIVSAAGKMTPAGRVKLADFQPGPPRRERLQSEENTQPKPQRRAQKIGIVD